MIWLDEPRRGVAIAGDWHGNTNWAVRAVKYARTVLDCDVIVHLGDFGIWPNSPEYLRRIDEECADDMRILFVDGNHEDHDFLNGLPVLEEGVRPVSQSVAHLPRGFRWNWHGESWLALGGAHSVDRQLRTPGFDWWPGETLTPEEVESAAADGHADIMVCHDCPAGVDIPGLSGGWPREELRSADAHRELIAHVVDAVKPKVLYHGHYHRRYTEQLNSTRIEGLDMDGFSLLKNMIVHERAIKS